MEYKYKYKKKSVHLEDLLHDKLRKRANKNGTSIEIEANIILKEKLISKKKKVKK